MMSAKILDYESVSHSKTQSINYMFTRFKVRNVFTTNSIHNGLVDGLSKYVSETKYKGVDNGLPFDKVIVGEFSTCSLRNIDFSNVTMRKKKQRGYNMKIKQRKVILLNLKGSLKVFEDDISISIDSEIVGSGHVDVKTKDYSYKDPTVASHVNAKGAITLWWGYTKGTILGHGV